jgi:hypothetical protein
MAAETKKTLASDQRVYVERFDELFGLEAGVLKIINAKIENCKIQAEYKVTKLKKMNDLLAQ